MLESGRKAVSCNRRLVRTQRAKRVCRSHARASSGTPSTAPRPTAQSSAAGSKDANQDLLTALLSQARREVLPWLSDLVEPLLLGPPKPLTDTRSPQELADPDSRFLTVDGVQLHYKQRCAEASVPSTSTQSPVSLLLLHGFNGSVFNWRLVMDDMAAYIAPDRGCRVVAYDRPPFGLSARPRSWAEGKNPYTSSAGAEFGRGLIEQLGLGRTVLVGHSAGAPVAIELARRYPHLVSGLVLVAPALSADDKGFLARADFGQLLRFAYTRALLQSDTAGLQYVRRQVLRRRDQVLEGKLGIYYDEGEIPQEVLDGYLKPMQAHDWDWGSLQVFRASELSAPPPYRSLQQPVLVVQGDNDTTCPTPVVRAVTERFETQRPGCVTQYVEVARCGHLPQEERPREVADAIVRFVNAHCAS